MLLGMDFGPEMAANKPATLLGMDFSLEMTANGPGTVPLPRLGVAAPF
jgi:hypothetical protein